MNNVQKLHFIVVENVARSLKPRDMLDRLPKDMQSREISSVLLNGVLMSRHLISNLSVG